MNSLTGPNFPDRQYGLPAEGSLARWTSHYAQAAQGEEGELGSRHKPSGQSKSDWNILEAEADFGLSRKIREDAGGGGGCSMTCQPLTSTRSPT